MIWITSDHHFNHENVIKYARRPFKSVGEMNEVMVKNWNELVGKDDLVIHLGDFSLGSKKERRPLRERLNGTIVLILGSHDGSKWRIAKDGFIVTEKPLYIGDLIFTHKPMVNVPPTKWNIHGHIHNRATCGRRINVSVEVTNYKPISLEELKNRVDRI